MLLRWTLAGTFGFALAGASLHFPGSFPVGSGGALNVGAGLFGAMLGAVAGLVAGVLLWAVARPRATSLIIPATALGFAVTHALGDGLPPTFDYLPIGLVGGAVLGAAQWYAFRDRPAIAPFVLASALALSAGILLGIAAVEALGLMAVPWTPTVGTQQKTIASATAGLLWSLTTGWRLFGPIGARVRPAGPSAPAPTS